MLLLLVFFALMAAVSFSNAYVDLPPYRIFAWNYRILLENGENATVEFSMLSRTADIRIVGEAYQVAKETAADGAPLSRRWILSKESKPLASAKETSLFLPRFVITADQFSFELATAGILMSRFIFLLDAEVIGALQNDYPWSRKAYLECSPLVPLPLQFFSVVIAVFSWRRLSLTGV